MPDTSMYSYRPMTAPEIGYAGAYGNYQHDMSAYMPGGYNSGGSGLLGMSEEQVYNLFYQATKTAIENSPLMRSVREDIRAGHVIEANGRELAEVVKREAYMYWHATGGESYFPI